MNTQVTKWQKATIIGSVWGAFEVVGGSLIHNLALPMLAGTILSAIGVMVMISGAKIFGGRGIFWRSALVCAALKTVSPSAVILSPIIGITLEGFLLELGVLVLGQNLAGYMLGGAMAVLSILGFKLVRLLMIYGTDLIEAYKSVFSITFTNKYLGTTGYIIPILILVSIYIVIGAFAAYSGVRSGIAIKKQLANKNLELNLNPRHYRKTIKEGEYKGGISFLIFHIIWLISFIAFKGFTSSSIWITGGVLYIILCLFRYGRIRALFSKPAFGIAILVVSITSSILISLGKNGNIQFTPEMIHLSLSIIIRATVVLIAFSCIGIEANSKGVAMQFRSSRFSSLAQSYSIANSILPSLLSTLKANSNKLHKPIPIIEKMYNQFTTNANDLTSKFPVIIITADMQAGKTTFIKEMILALEGEGIQYAGFFSDGIWDTNNKRSGFNLVSLPNKNSIPLCDRINTSWDNYGCFYFNPAAINYGIEIISKAPEEAVIFIDEIGKLELEGKVWAKTFEQIIERKKNIVVFTVRKAFLDEVIEKWDLHNAVVIDATVDCPEEIVKSLIIK